MSFVAIRSTPVPAISVNKTSPMVTGGILPKVSVKTKEDVPKDSIFSCMEAIRSLQVEAPVAIGDVLLTDIAGTGVDLVATKNIPALAG